MRAQDKIMYNNEDYFQIVPELKEQDIDAYRQYFDYVKLMTNSQDISSMDTKFTADNNDYFFWTIDYENSKIISNNATSVVYNNIINQLAKVLHWIFENGYSVIGSYCYRLGFTIGYISVDNGKKMINHNILLDKINIDEIDDHPNSIIQENLMHAAKNNILKMKLGMHTNNINDNKRNKRNRKYYNRQKLKTSKMHHYSDQRVILEETTTIIRSMQERLSSVENKMKSYDKFNMFILKYCTIMGLLTAGSIMVMCSLCGRNNT